MSLNLNYQLKTRILDSATLTNKRLNIKIGGFALLKYTDGTYGIESSLNLKPETNSGVQDFFRRFFFPEYFQGTFLHDAKNLTNEVIKTRYQNLTTPLPIDALNNTGKFDYWKYREITLNNTTWPLIKYTASNCIFNEAIVENYEPNSLHKLVHECHNVKVYQIPPRNNSLNLFDGLYFKFVLKTHLVAELVFKIEPETFALRSLNFIVNPNYERDLLALVAMDFFNVSPPNKVNFRYDENSYSEWAKLSGMSNPY